MLGIDIWREENGCDLKWNELYIYFCIINDINKVVMLNGKQSMKNSNEFFLFHSEKEAEPMLQKNVFQIHTNVTETFINDVLV